MKIGITGWALVLIISSAALATPALAGAGKGYGQQVLSRSESKKSTAVDNMKCPTQDHFMGDHHDGMNKTAGHHHNERR